MSDKPAATAAVAESKKRPRRLDAAQRQTAQEQEAARSQASQHSSRFLSKHKTRCVPDAPGMCILSKNEVKKDIKFLERNLSFSVSRDSDEDSDNATPDKKNGKAAVKVKKLPRNAYNPHHYYGHGGGVVMRSVKPPCAPESSILSKKRRYSRWLRPAAAQHFTMEVDEAAVARELGAYETAIAQMQFHLEGFHRTEEHWLQNVEHGRQVLAQAVADLATCNSRLDRDAGLLFAKCSDECRNSTAGGGRDIAAGVSRSSRRVAAAAASSAEQEPERTANLATMLRELRGRQTDCSRLRAARVEAAAGTELVAEAVFSLDEVLGSDCSSAEGAFALPAPAAATATASNGAVADMEEEEEEGAGAEVDNEEEEEGEDPVAAYLRVLDEVIRLSEASSGDADSYFVYRDVVDRDRSAGGEAGREQHHRLSSLLCERGGAGRMMDVAARLVQHQEEQCRLTAAAPQLACLTELLPAVDGVARLHDQAYWATVVEIVGRSSTLLHEAHARREAEAAVTGATATGVVASDEEEDLVQEARSGSGRRVEVVERQHSLISLEPLRALLGSTGLDRGGGASMLTAERALQLYMNATTATSSTTSTRKQSGVALKKLVLTTVILMNVSLSGMCDNRMRGYDLLAKNAAGETVTCTNYVPLLLSPLSQYSDFFAGSVTGGNVVYNDTTHETSASGMARGGVRECAANFAPAEVARQEQALMTKLGVLAKILALQNYHKRCIIRRNDWKRQLTKAQGAQQKAESLLRDLLEDISVEREMQAQLLLQQQASEGVTAVGAEGTVVNAAVAADKQVADKQAAEDFDAAGGAGSTTNRRAAGGRFSGARR